MLKILYSAYNVKSHSIVLCFSNNSLYVAFHMHVLEFVSSLSLSSWWRNYLTCFNLPVTFFGKGLFNILDEVFIFCFSRLCQGVFSYK